MFGVYVCVQSALVMWVLTPSSFLFPLVMPIYPLKAPMARIEQKANQKLRANVEKQENFR